MSLLYYESSSDTKNAPNFVDPPLVTSFSVVEAIQTVADHRALAFTVLNHLYERRKSSARDSWFRAAFPSFITVYTKYVAALTDVDQLLVWGAEAEEAKRMTARRDQEREARASQARDDA